ncbi:MAG TPA: hypothetical protein VE058_12725 [Steroidobacteraceae bacterium]|nr:hypothetical protein [Steroidobacteraceae bacterium]
MTEYQSIAIGLLGLTHPEIYRSGRFPADKPAQAASSALEPTLERVPTHTRRPGPGGTHAGAVVRAVKFAFAALMAGSRAVPLGDNAQLIRELGSYGERLSH